MQRHSPQRAVGWPALWLALLIVAPGCAYYNGIYNAKAATHSAEDRLRRGREGDANSRFQEAMVKAETVLVRYPSSRWRADALFYAGRGAAYVDDCPRALDRLNEYLTTADAAENPERAAKAEVALGICDLRGGRVTAATQRLGPLVESENAKVSSEASLWAARTALARGDRDEAERLFATLGAQRAEWELVNASVAAADWVRAESLLVVRARQADWRDDVVPMLRQLWAAGRHEGVESIATAYDEARLRDQFRTRLHFTVGEVQLGSRQDSLARVHFESVRRTAALDTIMRREAGARLVLLDLRTADSLMTVDSVLQLATQSVRGSLVYQRLTDGVLFYRMLQGQEDPTGASLFLAGEIARDSLRAPRLAMTTFRSIAERYPLAPIAAKGLYAAALVEPDSTEVMHKRIEAEYPTSAIALLLRGEDPASHPSFRQVDGLLAARWTATARAFEDTLRVRRERDPARAVGVRQP